MRSNTGQILYIPRVGQRANLQHPLMRGCVGWWPLTDGGGGIAKDISTGGNDGTHDVGLSHTATEIGNAVNFPGSGSIDSSVTVLSQPMTISAWAYPTTLPTNIYGKNIYTGQQSWGRVELNIEWQSSTGDVVAQLYSGTHLGSHAYLPGTTKINANEWVHLVGVYDGASSELYVNGVLDATGQLGSYTLSGGFRIGALWNGGYNFLGNIQNVRIWDRALSSSEILQLYTNPWSGLSMPSETRYFFLSSPSPTINPFSRIITSSTILNKSGKTVIRRGA